MVHTKAQILWLWTQNRGRLESQLLFKVLPQDIWRVDVEGMVKRYRCLECSTVQGEHTSYTMGAGSLELEDVLVCKLCFHYYRCLQYKDWWCIAVTSSQRTMRPHLYPGQPKVAYQIRAKGVVDGLANILYTVWNVGEIGQRSSAFPWAMPEMCWLIFPS